MTEKKLYLIIQSVLCVLMVILLVASAISIYCEGRALRAEDPMASIYTREKVVEKLRPISPLFFAAVGLTIAGWLLAVKDDNADKPVKDAESTRNLTVARVRLNGKELKEGDCELTWSEGCKDPGTYQVTARLRKGILAGADTAKFIIMEAADEGVLTLPAGLLLIESEAFAGVNAETVIVPKTCRWIGADAFLDCHNLKTVYVYAATVIEDDAFRGCDNVELVRF